MELVSAPPTERRMRRSSDPLVALHYQLSSTRSRGELDALVVADTSGVVVAGAGSWPVCEELAAYAPLLADDGEMTHAVSSRVASLRKEVEVRSLVVGGQVVLLCARRQKRVESREVGSAIERDLEQAAAGVSRILTSAAA